MNAFKSTCAFLFYVHHYQIYKIIIIKKKCGIQSKNIFHIIPVWCFYLQEMPHNIWFGIKQNKTKDINNERIRKISIFEFCYFMFAEVACCMENVYISSKNVYISSKNLYISSKNVHISSNDVYISSKNVYKAHPQLKCYHAKLVKT